MDPLATPVTDAPTGASAAFSSEVDNVEGGSFLLLDVVASSTFDAVVLPPAIPREGRDPLGASRPFDLIVASALLIFALPLMLFCAVAVLLSGPGPIVFRQTRIGRGGQQFTCLKFRTMVFDADLAMQRLLKSCAEAQTEWEALQKLQHDPRVTATGRFLRRYCLDELPQIFNVLAGQMSVVGPRPIVADEIARYGENFADYCSIKPGLTGLWQISGRHALAYEERVRLDTAYARSKSLRGDLTILWRTVPIVLRGENS